MADLHEMRRGDLIERGLRSSPDDCWTVFGLHAAVHSKHWHLFCCVQEREMSWKE